MGGGYNCSIIGVVEDVRLNIIFIENWFVNNLEWYYILERFGIFISMLLKGYYIYVVFFSIVDFCEWFK